MSIFISYRRGATSDVAGRIRDRLCARFGDDQVFIDVESLPIGEDFHTYLTDAVGACDVLVAVIGPDWNIARLNAPEDFVRIEIECALANRIPVIPVLVGDADMPSSGTLPADLAPLIRRNALRVGTGSDFKLHVAQLIDGIERIRAARNPRRPKRGGGPTRKVTQRIGALTRRLKSRPVAVAAIVTALMATMAGSVVKLPGLTDAMADIHPAGPLGPASGDSAGLWFDGIDDEASSAPVAAISKHGQYTFLAWIRPAESPPERTDASSPAPPRQLTVFQNSFSTRDRNGALIVDGVLKCGYFHGAAGQGGTGQGAAAQSGWKGVSARIPSNRWVHVACTNDGGTLALYVDGQRRVGREASWYLHSTRGFRLGSISSVSGKSVRHYAGQIADVRIWDSALSEAQVRTQMSAPPSGSERGLVRYWPLAGPPHEAGRDHSNARKDLQIHGPVILQPQSTDAVRLSGRA